MKVFTVGLDQKQPLDEGAKEKADSPPPGYSTTTNSETRIPLPLGPELPRPPLPMPPPQPIIVRKSRGYKGILLVMLTVFLMAIFALVLSEMAYSRQRDENFFKLRWAELKHRMGYYDNNGDGPVDYYSRAANSIGDKFERMLNLAKSNELLQVPRVPQSLSAEEDTTNTSPSSSTPSTSTPESDPVVVIDKFPMAPSRLGIGIPSDSSSSSSSSSRSSSEAVEQPAAHSLFGSGSALSGALSQLRDARLQFLRNILQKIKQHADDIGFDGTMQVSIIEMEPQSSDSSSASNDDSSSANGPSLPSGGNWPNIFQRPGHQQVLQFPPSMTHFFPHPRPLAEDFKNSRSFLDGFGEMHQPLFMQSNQLQNEQEERPRAFSPWAMLHQQQQQQELQGNAVNNNLFSGMHQVMPSVEMQQQQQNSIMPSFMDSIRWPRVNAFRQPEMLLFHPFFQQQQQPMNMRFPPPPPPEWAQQPQQVQPQIQQQQQPQQQQSQNVPFTFGGAALSRPSSGFEHWNNPPPPPPLPQQQQQWQQNGQQMPMGSMIGGGGARPDEQQQTSNTLQQQQQPVMPQKIQHQIDFPEVKLSAPSVIGSSDSSSSEEKFPSQPAQQPQQQQQPAQRSQQPEQSQSQLKTSDWLPRWLFDTLSSAPAENKNEGGPPSSNQQQQQPEQPSELSGAGKFPSITILEQPSSSGSSSSSSGNSKMSGSSDSRSEEGESSSSSSSAAGRPSADAPPVDRPISGPKIVDEVHGEIGKIGGVSGNSGVGADSLPQAKEVGSIGGGEHELSPQGSVQPEELIEVDAAPQQSEQQQQPNQQEQQPAETQGEEQSPPKEQQPQPKDQSEETAPAAAPEKKPAMATVQLQKQQQKWFPEVPSVFFQVDDPKEQLAAPQQPAQDH